MDFAARRFYVSISLRMILLIGVLSARSSVWAQPPQGDHRPPPGQNAVQDAPLPPPRAVPRPLELPPDLPGSSAPEIRLPSVGPGVTEADRAAAISRLYERLPVATPEFQPPLGTEGRPLTLDDLQQMAVQRSPVLKQATADIQGAEGAALQAGLYPNPTIGFQADTIGTGGTSGYQGGFLNQRIVTGGKLQLDQSAASIDVQIARLTYQKTRIDVLSQVRGRYFDVLVALERIRISRALADFADRTYRVQIERVKAGEAAPYEPLQLRIAAVQARAQVIQAYNNYASAWRQLAASVSCPGMKPTPLAGRLDRPIPQVGYDAILCQILRVHPDMAIAQAKVVRDQIRIKLARVTPVPDVTVNTVVQQDNTVEPFGSTASVQLSIPLPLFDRNQGNILSADAALIRDCQERDRVRDDLVTNLADAFSRYQSSQVLVAYYRDGILNQQIMVYRGTYQRHLEDPDAVGFNDVVTAQQAVASNLTTYVQTLSDQWQGVVDLARLLQAEDVFQIGPGQSVSEIPTLAPPSPSPTTEALPVPSPETGGRSDR